MIRPVFSTDPTQPNQTRLTPVYSSGPMQPRQDVQSFDLSRNFGPTRSLVTGDRRLSGPTRSLVTGDRSLTRNPNGRMGMPQMPGGGQSYGKTPAAGYSGQRLNSFGQPFQGNKIRGVGYRDPGQRGYDQPQAAPQGYGQPAPGMPANNTQPLPAPLDPLANLPPPATTEQALGMPSYGSPAPAEANTEQPLLPPLNMPWTGQPLPGGMPMGQLPPSTMNGATGVPPPPDLEFRQLPGNPGYGVPVVRGEVQKQFLPMPSQTPRTFQMRQDATGAFRQFYGDEMLAGPTYSGQVVPGSYVRQATQGQPAPMQYTPDLPQPTEKITEGPTGTTRTYTQPRGTAPPAGEGGSNYFDSLLPAAPTASTQTGQMPVTPTASTQTGQMPAVLDPAMADELKPQEDVLQYYRERGTTYGNLSPEARQRMENGNNRLIAQTEAKIAAIRKKYSITPEAAKAQAAAAAQLLDEARNEYARTGNDAALGQYFAQYPTR
ncbi:MAG: hypothetical protein QE570_14365 [Verrucomicrobiota bacterium]|nr:hypothetical protein [Verrucomicrobiota bacterium]